MHIDFGLSIYWKQISETFNRTATAPPADAVPVKVGPGRVGLMAGFAGLADCGSPSFSGEQLNELLRTQHKQKNVKSETTIFIKLENIHWKC